MSDRDALRDELDFLLASIDDLERERAAGDVDEEDHRRLLDGYTVRAARIARLLDEPTASPAPSAGERNLTAASTPPKIWCSAITASGGIPQR